MKRLALAISLITSVALLSGCIVVPPRHGYYRDGGYYHRDGGYYRGGGYDHPGPR